MTAYACFVRAGNADGTADIGGVSVTGRLIESIAGSLINSVEIRLKKMVAIESKYLYPPGSALGHVLTKTPT